MSSRVLFFRLHIAVAATWWLHSSALSLLARIRRLRNEPPGLWLPMSLTFLLVSGCFMRGGVDIREEPVTAVASPTKNAVVYNTSKGDLYIYDIDDGKTHLLLANQVAIDSVFSPDGGWVLFSQQTEDECFAIMRLNVRTRAIERLTTTEGTHDRFPCMAADGSYVVFARATRLRPYSMGGVAWDDWDVWLYDMVEGTERAVTARGYWSVDSITLDHKESRILFIAKAEPRGGSRLYSVAATELNASNDIQEIATLTSSRDGKFFASGVAASRTGDTVAYVSDPVHRYHYDIIVLDRATGDTRNLNTSRDVRIAKSLSFGNDGDRIYFLGCKRFGHGNRPRYGLWTVKLDGKGLTNLAGEELFYDSRALER